MILIGLPCPSLIVFLSLKILYQGNKFAMDIFLDYFFFIFHTGLTLFNLIGWAWRKTRPYNLLTLGITGFSWFVLGIWKGIGYCPCTEWHWQVRGRLGENDMPHSYVKFVLDALTGLDFDSSIVDHVVFISYLIALIISVLLNKKYITRYQGRICSLSL